MKLVQEFVRKEDIMEEEILDKFKKIGYMNVISEHPTLILHNPSNKRTLYIHEDNSFVVGLGSPSFVGSLYLVLIISPTFKEKRLIKKLIKVRKEKINENNFNY